MPVFFGATGVGSVGVGATGVGSVGVGVSVGAVSSDFRKGNDIFLVFPFCVSPPLTKSVTNVVISLFDGNGSLQSISAIT